MAGQEIAPLYWFLQDPYTGAPRSVVPLALGGQWNFAFFSSEEGLWNFVDHFAHGQQHPITGNPLTRDSIVVESSGSVAELLALCDHLYIDEAISGFYIDPDPPPSPTPTPMELVNIKDRIQAMTQEDSP
jgi:hypothetical protein